MQIIFWAVVLIICLVALVKSADYFVVYSEKIGIAIGLSSFIIGATIVAIGTSLPELVSSMFAVLDAGVTEFVADNIIGSNIANCLLILGIGAIYAKTLKVQTSLIDIDLPFFFSSMALFAYFAWDKQISQWEGIMLLSFFFIFLIYSTKASEEPETTIEDKEEMSDLKKEYNSSKNKTKKSKFKKDFPYLKYSVYILFSMSILTISAKYLINSILSLSDLLNISSSMLTITVVALGTSLPEVITSIAAIKRGNHGIAIGNVFGSNTFNLLLVGGLPAIFTDLAVSESTFTIALPFLVIATFVTIFTTLDDKVRIWEGAAMLFLYFVFILKIVQVF